ncbi:uncharacterized protein LOC113384869 [Ctenocephalides felis]|uniref:uncharacterized protein LOC113384869 n=1 Tax=Ctenocephalides felis TaxID=7515 RepID=UPI000E6E3B8E|nr:uncharacterized protein LOC113384869 [Ctenocephalides felis]
MRVVLFFWICLVQFNNIIAKDELQFVFVMARGPDHRACDYPGGPKLTNLPEKSSELTNDGKKEAFELGQLLDKVYRGQLKIKKWDSNENYWPVATNTKRTKTATLIIGAGLENNRTKAFGQWSEEQLKSTHFDAMPGFLRFLNPSECPAYFREFGQQAPNVKKITDKYQDTINAINSKYESIGTAKPENVWLAYETFKRMKHQKKSDMQWLNSTIMENLKQFSSQYILTAVTSTEKLRKLAGGLILKDLLNDMDELTSGRAQPHAPGKLDNKMNIFVVPQALLIAQMAVFTPKGTKISNQDVTASNFYPDDGSYVVIELYKNNQSWKVQIKYKNDKNSGWKPLKVNGCNDSKCPYNTFKNAVKKYIIDEGKHKQLCKQ